VADRDWDLNILRLHRWRHQPVGAAIFENIKQIEPPHDDKNYFFDKDMADKAIERIRLLKSIAPTRPWVTYFAPGTAHAPHHAPKDWIAKFKGQFDQGWDKGREGNPCAPEEAGVSCLRTQAD